MKRKQPIRCLITAGPTREFFDPVRYLSNPSSGKMGYALAAAAAAHGWQVDLVSGPTALEQPQGVIRYPIVTGKEMLWHVQRLFKGCDILIKAAAVCDFRPKYYSRFKLKKIENAEWTAQMVAVTDILATTSAGKRPDQIVVGFAAETDHLEANAMRKLRRKNLDWIVVNQVGRTDSGFESDMNTLVVLGKNGERYDLGHGPKPRLARELVSHLSRNLPS